MKRFISVIICLALFLSCLAPTAFAKSAETEISATKNCDCGLAPIVYVAALGSAKIYSNLGTENEKLLFRPEASQYISLVKELIVPIIKLAITKNYDSFGDSLVSELNAFIGDLAMDDNGDSLPYVTADGAQLPTDPTHGINNSYYFGYDFRIDPLVTAQKLNEYIERIKEITGHEKVNIRASSMGGVMMMSYLYKYGASSVDSLIFQCCPIQGTAVAGELLSKNVTIDKGALVRYATQALPELENPTAEKLLGKLITVLDKTGVFDYLTKLANKLVSELLDKVYDEFLIPVLGKMPGIWSFVPDENYIKAKATSLDSEKNAALIRRLDEYHYNVQCNAKQILTDTQNSGVRIMIVASYNMQRTPLVSSYKNNSDATVDTKYASVGATAALLGETLGSGYTQKVADGHNHVSTDLVIDASTCALPENTWFIKDMMHCSTHVGHMDFYKWFFLGEERYDVFTNSAYPQFLQNDTVNEKLIPIV